MTRRGLTFLLLCASALAQLPRSQAPKPFDVDTETKRKRGPESDPTRTVARVDAVVTDLEGRSVPGLAASDFVLETDGKPRTVQSCQLYSGESLRLAVILDDLALNLDQSNAARRALRGFVDSSMRPGDEMVVLRASEGSGALDRFSADKAEIQAAINRARFQSSSAAASQESFETGAVGVMRTALEGMRELPGRKAVLLISTGLRRRVKAQLSRAADRGSVVVYGVDLGAEPNPTQLDEGVAALAKETGGVISADVSRALARIVADQSSYYVLTFYADDAGFDYITRAPRIDRVALRTNRMQTSVRARDGLFGLGEDAEGEGYHEVEREFERAIDSELIHDGIRLRVTPLLGVAGGWQIESAVHLDARDLTFVKTVDGRYRTSLDTAVGLYDASGEAVKETVRSFDANLNEKSFLDSQKDGFDYTVVLPLSKEGAYQVRVAVRDVRSGRIGSARRFVRAEGWQGGKLGMTSILLRGEMQKNEGGVEVVRDAEEAASVRRFAAGHSITYNFHLVNAGMDQAKSSRITSRTEMWRDGVRVFSGDPKDIDFPPLEGPGARAINGLLQLGKDMPPGIYELRIEVTDRIVPRTVTQWMDFEVRP